MSNGPGVNSNVPQIPQPVANVGALANVAQVLKQAVDSLAGNRGDTLNRAVTFQDLLSYGIVTRKDVGAPAYDGSVSALSTESARAQATETKLTKNLQTVTDDLGTLTGQVDNLSGEVTSLSSTITLVNNSLAVEVARAKSTETSLTSGIATQHTGLTAETSARQAADTTLTNNLNTEITNRANADALRLLKAGVTDGSNAPSGEHGEYIPGTRVQGSPLAMTNAVAATVTQIALTPGDWDVSFQACFTGSTSAAVNWITASISTVSGATQAALGGFALLPFYGQTPFVYANPTVLNGGPQRFNITSAQTLYLTVEASFTSTMSVYGIISARRMR